MTHGHSEIDDTHGHRDAKSVRMFSLSVVE